MRYPDKRYSELAEKWLNGTITEEEKEEFAQWYAQEENSPLNVPADFAGSEQELRRRLYNKITKARKKEGKIISIRKNVKVAVAAIFILAAGLWFYFYTDQKKPFATAGNQIDLQANRDILPGGNKAVLILGDGSKIVLDTAMNGTVTENQHIQVIKLNDGQLAYSSTGKKKSTDYNTLSTPRGGQYTVILADGTKVWLNSASTLRFPTSFSGTDRVVELSGEAYFEVAVNVSQQFRVKLNNMEVQVLGTHFNVMAYEDEELVKTTLLEGSLRIHKNTKVAMLKPGEQAQVGKDNYFEIRKDADTQEAVAWKNGLFNFEGANIETIMRQMARWYNIEVIYQDKINDHFNGTISRHVGIQKVFEMLELTEAVHFIIEENKVIVRF